ncbi:hypothetical protein SDC9_88265 [bioreactor metagenome]|uniref:Uncharacterized protein n=1 Tax=bioreactor metagenome TaxID=1076179 RepID=A0A644ZL42_9ZZZZ
MMQVDSLSREVVTDYPFDILKLALGLIHKFPEITFGTDILRTGILKRRLFE